MFKVQSSKLKVQSSKLKVQSSKFNVQSSKLNVVHFTLFHISVLVNSLIIVIFAMNSEILFIQNK